MCWDQILTWKRKKNNNRILFILHGISDPYLPHLTIKLAITAQISNLCATWLVPPTRLLSFSLRISYAHTYCPRHFRRFYRFLILFLMLVVATTTTTFNSFYSPIVFSPFAFSFSDISALLELLPITLVELFSWTSSCSNLDRPEWKSSSWWGLSWRICWGYSKYRLGVGALLDETWVDAFVEALPDEAWIEASVEALPIKTRCKRPDEAWVNTAVKALSRAGLSLVLL